MTVRRLVAGSTALLLPAIAWASAGEGSLCETICQLLGLGCC